MLIDLHAHSTASDGTDSPAELVAAAATAGVQVLALTDHDSTAGWDEAADAALRLGVTLVPGVEISCQVGGISVHLLCYLPDPQHPGLAAEFARVRTDRLTRAERMVAAIAADHPLTWDDVLDQITGEATVGRPHIADALVAKGLVADRNEAFERMLSSRSPYYVPHYAPSGVAAVRLARAAGGVPVMAHPLAGRRGAVVDDAAILDLVAAGLAGVEVHHRDHLPQERAHLERLAAQHGLLVTGSSDYHGHGKPNRLGEHSTTPEALAALLAQATGTAPVGTPAR